MQRAMAPRLILFHKQKTSARTRFLCFHGSVLAFAPLPEPATVRPAGLLRLHPAALLQEAQQRLGLAPGALEAMAEFAFVAATPDGDVPVLLAGFTAIDPPFTRAAEAGGRFVSIVEARGLPAVELELLRYAYEVLIG